LRIKGGREGPKRNTWPKDQARPSYTNSLVFGGRDLKKKRSEKEEGGVLDVKGQAESSKTKTKGKGGKIPFFRALYRGGRKKVEGGERVPHPF